MSPVGVPTIFSHKYTEKQLYKLGVSDTASQLNSTFPGILCSRLACRTIAQILIINHSYTGNFLLRSSHTKSSTRFKATKFNFPDSKNLLKKSRETLD